MPRKDGTGPPWAGNAERGIGRGGGGGRMEGTHPGAGPGGNCVCLSCKVKVPHQAGTPCYNLSCPKCGTKMLRR
jgi:hypothetical protein